MEIVTEEGGARDILVDELVAARKEDRFFETHLVDLVGERDGEHRLASSGGHLVTEEDRPARADGRGDIIQDLVLLLVQARVFDLLIGRGLDEEVGVVKEHVIHGLINKRLHRRGGRGEKVMEAGGHILVLACLADAV